MLADAEAASIKRYQTAAVKLYLKRPPNGAAPTGRNLLAAFRQKADHINGAEVIKWEEDRLAWSYLRDSS
jgi:hypothetical protein